MTRKLQLVYHGTDKKTAAIIKVEGFKADTWFAIHLEDAVGFGGEYVFEVMYPTDRVPEEAWQFMIRKHLSPEAIVRLKKYQVSTVFEDKVKGTRVFESNLSPQDMANLTRYIKAHPEDYPEENHTIFNPATT